jgi:hypothetical protein
MAKRALSCLLLTAAICGAHAQQLPDVEALKKQLSAPVRAKLASYQRDASVGDYQAMRNLAYVWSTDAARENRDASIVGCAWYALILQRHASRAHAGDVSNKDLYCGRLTADQARSAGALVATINESSPLKKPIAGSPHG